MLSRVYLAAPAVLLAVFPVLLAALPVLATPALACVAVEQDRVLAKDLVSENPWFARFDPALEIAPTPLAGITRVIKTSDLVALVRRNQIAAEVPADLSTVCVVRAAAPLTAERLQPVLEQALGGSGVRILEFSRYPVPQGELEFTRRNLTAAGMWRGRVIYGGRHSTPVWAKVALEPKEVDSSAAKPSSAHPRDIQRGEQVTVEVTSGGARLAFQTTAESSGHVGDFVLVRNPENGRLFQAKALGNGKVLIHK